MALGTVQVNNLNLGQGAVTDIERHFLFIGKAGNEEEASQLYSVNAQSDLTNELADSALRTQVIAAQITAGQNWTAAVYPLADDEDLYNAIDRANEIQSYEMLVICDELNTTEQLNALQLYLMGLQSQQGRFVSAIAAIVGIDSATQNWSEYEAASLDLVDGIAAPLVLPVPQLHGNNVGVLAGRLCDHSVSIADSPMRVATGSVNALDASPIDKDANPLSLATLNTLANARLSVPQWYPDFAGIYWGDGSTLDAIGGDYNVIENIRVVHKASRRIRMLAIRQIGDRTLNSTPNSIQQNKNHFMKPLRVMSKSTTINGKPFPGEVSPPKEGDIEITWSDKNNVIIYLVVRPYNSPKGITVNILLDRNQV